MALCMLDDIITSPVVVYVFMVMSIHEVIQKEIMRYSVMKFFEFRTSPEGC